MLVSALRETVARDERRLQARLGDMKVADDGSVIEIADDTGNKAEYELDEVTEKALTSFLSVNYPYISNCPPQLKAHNLNYWMNKSEDAVASVIVGPHGIESIHDPNRTILSVPEVAGVIARSFDPDDQIVTLRSNPGIFHADIMVSESITVPGNGLGDRPDADGYLRRPGDPDTDDNGDPVEPPKVFDITHGGVRFLAYPTRAKAPVVQRYFNRLICNNGLTMPVVDEQITLRGHTLEEVLGEMERAAQSLLGTMPQALERYADLSNVPVHGNPLAVIRHIGKEQGISDRVIARALDFAAASGLGSADRVSAYDVTNVFTSLANSEGIRYSTATRLQNVGGVIVHESDRIVRRCESCAQLV